MTRTIVHIPEEIANKYRFVVVSGKRCDQLQRGAYPKVEVTVPVSRQGHPQEAPKLASFWSQVSVREVEESRIAFEEADIVPLDYTIEAPISVE
jgi:hypothetical protein